MTTKPVIDRVIICGCGAIGSHIAYNISDPAIQLYLIDDDTIDDGNIPTSMYGRTKIGVPKADALANQLYVKDRCICHPDTNTLKKHLREHKFYDRNALVIDAFDNSAARLLTAGLPNPTLHVGVSAEKTGLVAWDGGYVITKDTHERGNNPICTHDMGKPIILTTSAAAYAAYHWYATTGEKMNILTTEYSMRRI